MTAKCCAGCGQYFYPRSQVPAQTFCSSRNCQKARKCLWQYGILRLDPDYRENQRAAQRAWQARNPEYWRDDRSNRKDKTIAKAPIKMDMSKQLPTGIYRIRNVAQSERKNSSLWLIEISPACLTCPCKMDV